MLIFIIFDVLLYNFVVFVMLVLMCFCVFWYLSEVELRRVKIGCFLDFLCLEWLLKEYVRVCGGYSYGGCIGF